MFDKTLTSLQWFYLTVAPTLVACPFSCLTDTSNISFASRNIVSVHHSAGSLDYCRSSIGLLFVSLAVSRLSLDVRETIDFEDHAFALDKLQEVLGDHRLSMLLSIVKLRAPVLSFYGVSIVLCIIKIDLVLNEYILAEVAWQIGCFDYVHKEVDPAIH